MNLADAPVLALPWAPSYRLIASRFPPVAIFDAVNSAEELEVIAAIQALTSDRFRSELGAIERVDKADQVFGHGSTPVMAAFCYLNPQGSRFTDGSYGIYYAANSLDVAASEIIYHRERFMLATLEPAAEFDMRCYTAHLVQPLVDIRGANFAAAHDPGRYEVSQRLGREARQAGVWGLLYNSVRSPDGGECVAVLRPNAIRIPVTQHSHITMVWDGSRVTHWYKKSALKVVGTAPSAKA